MSNIVNNALKDLIERQKNGALDVVEDEELTNEELDSIMLKDDEYEVVEGRESIFGEDYVPLNTNKLSELFKDPKEVVEKIEEFNVNGKGEEIAPDSVLKEIYKDENKNERFELNFDYDSQERAKTEEHLNINISIQTLELLIKRNNININII